MKLHELLKYEGPALAIEFEKASISGRGTSQEVADFREHALQDLVARYFPFPYRVAKGNIIDTFGNESDSVDCLLLNPTHPHTVDRFDKFSVILAEGVDAAIELKPDLQSKAELERGLAQIQSVKKLVRAKSPLLLKGQYAKHLVDESLRVPGFIFASKVKSNPIDTVEEIKTYYRANSVPVIEQLDFIIVNNRITSADRNLRSRGALDSSLASY